MDYVSETWDISVYILGNHEFYSCRHSHDSLLDAYTNTIRERWSNIHLLHNTTLGINHVGQTWAIIGSTAWGSADFSLVLSINDFRKIKSYNNPREHLKPISVKEYQELHNRDMEYLIREIDCTTAGVPIVIVTHFPLTRDGTSSPIYQNQKQSIKHYYANELHDKMKGRSDLTVVSGHTHYKYDFIMDDVRYIGNYLE
jgi:hypothetical protein